MLLQYTMCHLVGLAGRYDSRPVRRFLKRYGYILVGTGCSRANASASSRGKFWISSPSEIVFDAILE